MSSSTKKRKLFSRNTLGFHPAVSNEAEGDEVRNERTRPLAPCLHGRATMDARIQVIRLDERLLDLLVGSKFASTNSLILFSVLLLT
jgi:hypothetical protein